MDNGSEVIAKLPNSIAGPAYYTTASEVATREFVSSSTSYEGQHPISDVLSYAVYYTFLFHE